MSRLPSPGSDVNAWGEILNDFLTQAHNADGTLKDIAQSNIINLSTDLGSKADKARTITAGTGLTGGGDLSADRSLAVSFGTTSSTVSRGDSYVTAQTVYVSPNGSDSNSGLTPALAKKTLPGALAAFPTDPLIVKLGYAPISNPIDAGTGVDLTNRIGVTIEGLGRDGRMSGVPSLGSPLSVLQFTHAGSTPIINCQGARTITLRGFGIVYTLSSYTGHVVDATSCVQLVMQDMVITGTPSSARNAASCVNLGNSQEVVFDTVNFEHSQIGLNRSDTAAYVNVVEVRNCRFFANVVRNISNVDTSYTITNTVFEQLRTGDGAGIINDAGVIATNLVVQGCWFGDVTIGVGGNQIDAQMNGGSIAGNFIATKSPGACVRLQTGSTGFSITGNVIHGSNTDINGIEFESPCTNYLIFPNTFETIPTTGNEVYPATSPRQTIPTVDWKPAEHGFVTWNFDISMAQSSTIPTAGLLQLVRLHLPTPQTVTNVCLYVTAGTSLTTGQCFAGLWRANGTRVAMTADQAASWMVSGEKTMPLLGGPFNLAAGDYYVGYWANNTSGTNPAFLRGVGAAGVNFNLSAPNLRYATANSGLTISGPSTFGAQTPLPAAVWAALS